MLTTTFLEGGTSATFDLSMFININGNSTPNLLSDATVVKTGPRSLKVISDGNSNNPFLTSPTGVMADAGSRVDFDVKFSAFPGTTSDWLQDVNAGLGFIYGIQVTSAGVLGIRAGAGGGTVKSGSTLSTGIVYRISVAHVITATNNYTIKVFLNSTLDSTMTQADVSLSNSVSSMLLIGWSSSNGTGTYNLSDLYIDNGSTLDDPGDIRVTAKRPNANGTTNGFTASGTPTNGIGTGNAPYVSQRPSDQTALVSKVGAGSAVTEEYTIENAATGDVDLTGATIIDSMAWAFASSLASETASIIAAGGTANIALTSTPTMFTKAVGSATYPSGGNAVGMITSTDLTTVSLYEAGMLVAYTPAAPAVAAADSFPQSILVSRMREW